MLLSWVVVSGSMVAGGWWCNTASWAAAAAGWEAEETAATVDSPPLPGTGQCSDRKQLGLSRCKHGQLGLPFVTADL